MGTLTIYNNNISNEAYPTFEQIPIRTTFMLRETDIEDIYIKIGYNSSDKMPVAVNLSTGEIEILPLCTSVRPVEATMEILDFD